MSNLLSLSELISQLHDQGYRCLAPINQIPDINITPYLSDLEQGNKAIWALVDSEGFGPNVSEVNPATAELIELGILTLLVDLQSNSIVGKIAEYDGYRDPGMPVPQIITDLTGITTSMVENQSLDLDAIEMIMSDVSVIVAHNASYDRPVLERCVPLAVFKDTPWVCSFRDIDWVAAGYSSAKLDYLVVKHGFWYEAHRADTDCLALGHVLNHQTSYIQQLAEAVGKSTAVLYATGSPISVKDVLKSHGYRWSPGENGYPKAWYKEVTLAEESTELDWLGKHGYLQRPGSVLRHGLPPHARFSLRAPQITSVLVNAPTPQAQTS